ncbi:hypothetical protein B0H19DRAFT_1071687 [Mycena capillaripes]|nr:hypothetical protein B0H19DRAFT_1071687 [Mycena capillaripes]
MVPLGHIDLRREIHFDADTDLVQSVCRKLRARRVYTAKIYGQKSPMTVAVYQGVEAQAEWQADILRYSWLWHPNFVQLCGAVASGKICAAVFNDDLIPLKHFLALYRHSPIVTVYIYAYCTTEYKVRNSPPVHSSLTRAQAARDYFYGAFRRLLFSWECTFFIRRSTGGLCADLVPSHIGYWHYADKNSISDVRGITSLNTTDQETLAINSLNRQQYHRICNFSLSQRRCMTFSLPVTVTLGAVLLSPSDQSQDLVEMAWSPDVEFNAADWYRDGGEVMENGWTRFISGDVLKCTRRVHLWCPNSESWLSQASAIFRRLGITSHFENYVLVDDAHFGIQISALEDPPSGFLFLCPAQYLQTGPLSFRWPECPAYWSRDPMGVERLSTQEANAIGFPSIDYTTTVIGLFWDATVYAGLHQFDQAKGLDSDAQDSASHLGAAAFRLSAQMNPPLTHGGS